MDLTEEILVACADALGSRKVSYQGTEISFEPPFKRATMVDLVKEFCGVDIEAVASDEEARKIGKSKGLEITGKETRFGILTELFEAYVEDKLIQPTFVLGHPVEVSPLAKRNYDAPDYTNRFELFVYG